MVTTTVMDTIMEDTDTMHDTSERDKETFSIYIMIQDPLR